MDKRCRIGGGWAGKEATVLMYLATLGIVPVGE